VLLRIIKSVVSTKVWSAREARKNAARVDGNLPLGLRIGAMVSFDDVPFILYESIGGLVKQPQIHSRIVGYGKQPVIGGLMHRFYLDGDSKHVLRYVTDPDGNLIENELRLFQQIEEFTNLDLEGWNSFLGNPDDEDASYWIGYEWYCPDIEGFDVEQPYIRQVDDDNADDDSDNLLANPQIKPLMADETVYGNPTAEQGKRQSRQFMLYGRSLGKEGGDIDVPEYCTLSQVDDGAEQWVEVLAGIELKPTDIEVVQTD